jgi:hypothetical protein
LLMQSDAKSDLRTSPFCWFPFIPRVLHQAGQTFI